MANAKEARELARLLKIAAAKATIKGKPGATDKQIWHLANLVIESGAEVPFDMESSLSIAEASLYIEQIKEALGANNVHILKVSE